jgi:hypothetical protein
MISRRKSLKPIIEVETPSLEVETKMCDSSSFMQKSIDRRSMASPISQKNDSKIQSNSIMRGQMSQRVIPSPFH